MPAKPVRPKSTKSARKPAPCVASAGIAIPLFHVTGPCVVSLGELAQRLDHLKEALKGSGFGVEGTWLRPVGQAVPAPEAVAARVISIH